jgi:hypothetical protein
VSLDAPTDGTRAAAAEAQCADDPFARLIDDNPTIATATFQSPGSGIRQRLVGSRPRWVGTLLMQSAGLAGVSLSPAYGDRHD